MTTKVVKRNFYLNVKKKRETEKLHNIHEESAAGQNLGSTSSNKYRKIGIIDYSSDSDVMVIKNIVLANDMNLKYDVELIHN